MTAVLNHLWQSTVFAAVAALIAIALRNNHARTRYWIWMAASLKFLIPFSLLVSIGNRVEWRSAPAIVAQPAVTFAMDEISQPFAPIASSAAGASAPHSVMPTVLMAIWIGGCAIVLISWFGRWRRVRSSLHRATPARLQFPIKVMSSPALIEPGIFGIFRPVLLLPEGIADRLTPAQLQSILAHELCHVRRRDNLAAAIHMLVEAIFWFHPLVWWIGARLIEERERACDEEVLRSGSEPGVYAESILQVCKFYLESPLECAAGVTGSDLKRRIESIMNARFGRGLTPARKLLLAAASIGAIAGPLIFGALTAPRIRAQTQSAQSKEHLAFEVASVKPNKTADNRGMRIQSLPGGGLSATGVPLYVLMVFAYDLPIQSSRISGGPDWLRSDRFDVEAKANRDAIPKGATVKAREAKTRLMLQTLLADRFKLVIRIDKKELPVYAAVVGKNGPKLQKSKIDEKDCSDSGATVAGTTCHAFSGGMGRGLHGDAVDMSDLVGFVTNWTDRPVIDKTGIQGLYNIQTDGWTPMIPRAPSPDGTVSDEAQALADPARPTLQMVLDRLGLKLESQKAPIDMYVIEHVERPSDNFEPPIAAQEKATPEFEVASIHRSDPDHVGFQAYFLPGGKFTAMTAPLKNLVGFAYQLREHQVTGGPGWIDTEPFDISAKADAPANDDQLHQMVQALLADRFQLKFHRETKEQPVYTLVLAKSGPKLKEVKTVGRGVGIGMRGRLNGNGADMETLASVLSTRLGRSVVDRTGLKGFYDFVVTWTPDEVQPDTPGPSLFTALQEQLGLKLESSKGPVEILVIDHVEKPTEN
jgi:uncharacterized protein (TIGR03435 family)